MDHLPFIFSADGKGYLIIASKLIKELRNIFIQKYFVGFYALFIQWGEDMTKSMHPLTRGKVMAKASRHRRDPIVY